jgi:hypothetical protein
VISKKVLKQFARNQRSLIQLLEREKLVSRSVPARERAFVPKMWIQIH